MSRNLFGGIILPAQLHAQQGTATKPSDIARRCWADATARSDGQLMECFKYVLRTENDLGLCDEHYIEITGRLLRTDENAGGVD